MRFLFTTIQSFESDFYGRVGTELVRRGHEVAHVTISRRSARELRARGAAAYCLPDELGGGRVGAEEVAEIERRYRLASIREAYRGDAPSERRGDGWAVPRTVRYVRAVERLFDEIRPDVLVPEVGTELIRTVAHLVARERGVPTLFLFYTIFPRPLRLYVDTLHAPIVPEDEVRPLEPEERREVEEFVRSFTEQGTPIRAHRRVAPTRARLRGAAEYLTSRLGPDRDNEYLRPGRWALEHALGWARIPAARTLYRGLPERPFLYFPLHVTEDYKIKRVIPQWADQAALVEQVADVLQPGYELVLKEHPLSIGRNPLGLLRRLSRARNVRLVHPRTSTHELIERAAGLVVISSTVGLEALLYGKPVLTIGRPFYAGYGVTVDVDSIPELREAIPALDRFRPDRERILRFVHAAMRRCRAGAPVLVDRSQANAVTLAGSLDEAARGLAEDRGAPLAGAARE